MFALTLAYHIWHMGLWPWDDVLGMLMILILRGQINRVFDMALCLGVSFFVLWNSHTMFDTWVDHLGKMCHMHSWPYDLDLWLWYQHYIFTMNLCLGKIIFALWYRYTKLGTCMYQHEKNINDLCMTLSFDLYMGSGGYTSWVFLTVFILFWL